MRKLGAFILGATLSFAFALIEPKSLTAYANEETVYIGGMPAGFTLTTGGTQVIGICEVVSEQGVFSPALDAGIQAGDKIVKVNHIQVETIEELNKLVNNSNGNALNIEIIRKNERKNIEIFPIKDKLSNQYKIGVLVRDSVSGIGITKMLKACMLQCKSFAGFLFSFVQPTFFVFGSRLNTL